MVAALTAENAERCDPPLPQEQVEKIARSVARYEPAHSEQSAPLPHYRHKELEAVSEEITWAIWEWLVIGELCAYAGRPGAIKTWLMLLEVACLSLGTDFPIGTADGQISRLTNKRGVAGALCLDGRLGGRYKMRLGNIYETLTGDRLPREAAFDLCPVAVNVNRPDWWVRICDWLRESEQHYGLPAVYLGIDHARRVGLHRKESWAAGVDELQDGIAELRAVFPELAVRLLIHTRRSLTWADVQSLGAREAPYGGTQVGQAMDTVASVRMRGPDPDRVYFALANQGRDLPGYQEVLGVSLGTDMGVFDLRTEELATLEEVDVHAAKAAQQQLKYVRAVETVGNSANTSQVAKEIGVSRQVAGRALARLEEAGHMHRDDNGIWRPGKEDNDDEQKALF